MIGSPHASLIVTAVKQRRKKGNAAIPVARFWPNGKWIVGVQLVLIALQFPCRIKRYCFFFGFVIHLLYEKTYGPLCHASSGYNSSTARDAIGYPDV
jgi:hypothetical protein